jgi:uncharacterized OB-fold protein
VTARADWTAGSAVLLVSRCRSCGERWYLPRERCRACRGADIADEPAEGGGTAVAVTYGGVVHDPSGGGAGGIALVDLDEGVRAMTRCSVEVRPGSRVVVGIVVESPDVMYPVATPAEQPA